MRFKKKTLKFTYVITFSVNVSMDRDEAYENVAFENTGRDHDNSSGNLCKVCIQRPINRLQDSMYI